MSRRSRGLDPHPKTESLSRRPARGVHPSPGLLPRPPVLRHDQPTLTSPRDIIPRATLENFDRPRRRTIGDAPTAHLQLQCGQGCPGLVSRFNVRLWALERWGRKEDNTIASGRELPWARRYRGHGHTACCGAELLSGVIAGQAPRNFGVICRQRQTILSRYSLQPVGTMIVAGACPQTCCSGFSKPPFPCSRIHPHYWGALVRRTQPGKGK